MAAPDQQQQGGQEVAKLFQNVGQGLVLINQYVAQAVPDAQGMVQELIQRYEEIIQMVGQARQGEGQGQPEAGGPRPQEAGAADVRQAF